MPGNTEGRSGPCRQKDPPSPRFQIKCADYASAYPRLVSSLASTQFAWGLSLPGSEVGQLACTLGAQGASPTNLIGKGGKSRKKTCRKRSVLSTSHFSQIQSKCFPFPSVCRPHKTPPELWNCLFAQAFFLPVCPELPNCIITHHCLKPINSTLLYRIVPSQVLFDDPSPPSAMAPSTAPLNLDIDAISGICGYLNLSPCTV